MTSFVCGCCHTFFFSEVGIRPSNENTCLLISSWPVRKFETFAAEVAHKDRLGFKPAD